MPRFTVKKVPHPAGGYYYSVRKDGKEITGSTVKHQAEALMHAARRKQELKEKRKKGTTIY